MTIEEIIDAFCKSKHLVRKKGASPEPILPYLMMDCVFQMYCEWVLKLDLRHLAKKYRNDWYGNSHDFNQRFFKAFNADQTEEVIAMMDDFEEYIHNDLVITKLAIMNCLDDNRTLEEQQVASSCLLGEVLCWSAMTVWKNVFEKVKVMDGYHQIDKVRKSIHRFLNVWYKPRTHINIAEDPKCEKAITALCNKMIRYLVKDAKRRMEEAG